MTTTERPIEGYRATVARLASAQKGAAKGAPAYSIYVNRKLGRFIAAAAYRAGLTPNAVTAVSAAFTFSGIILLATVPPVWWSGVLIWLLLAVGYAFDSADGQVARLRGGGSAAGEWLDHVVDALKISSLHIAVLISAYRFFDLPSDAWLLVPIGYSIVANVTFFAMILNDQLKHVRGRKGTAEAGGGSRLRSFLVIPTDYGLLCFVFVLLGAPLVFFVVYGLLFLANAGFLLLAAVKWFRDMVALDAPESEGAR
ncbi:CDP-alcohol phosphatidyltransferase-like enzyme [Labedella gwakjiensis]|uniref:CDP-alcohol phosphatidyltransferase family protein n=1 Tax=Labedella gwakjiensis TaxID=390269 RepID=A0A2P8GSH5_9MICO|nr:CDP-alcohol phosphatidyltransferase family protein [Labedella gwakjiensis]PSL36902.1 CDP-alcohol phosphatidyltransferase-like enzyme [Labedella gwakjiensis]RUQ84395.1 CDP-alcohol phosphatidyltransferase family protein [Labedella gwakjiensis]